MTHNAIPLPPVLCGHVPAPVNITMDSHHFVHLLTWQAGPDSPVGLRYRVHIRTYKYGPYWMFTFALISQRDAEVYYETV